MASKRSVTEKLTDSIKLDDEELIDEIVESEDWIGEPEIIMSEQADSKPRNGEKFEGLTPEERKRLEACMRRNDELMKCLARM